MFETSVVRARSKSADRRAMLLTLSIAAHAAVVIGVVATSVATVSLPDRAPRQFSIPILPVDLQPKFGDGGAAKKPAAATQPKQPVAMPRGPVAPAIVPERVAPVASQAASSDSGLIGDAAASASTSDDGGPGVPWGSRDGVGDGPPVTATPPTIYAVKGDVKAPVVIRRVSPPYPPVAQRMHLSGFVILECIIDRSGRIRDAHVVQSSFGAFEQPALDAVQQWQFAPGTLNGQPVDVVFDLKVTFEIK